MPDNDAFGVEEQHDSGAEVFETGDATPQGSVVEVEEVDQGTAGEESSWLDAIDDPAIRDAASKYQSPAELARATVEAQRKLGEQGNEIGQLREMFQELMNGQQQPDYGPMPGNQQGPPAPPDFAAVNQFAQWTAQRVRNGEIDPEQGMAEIAQAQSEVYQKQLEARLGAMEASVEQRLSQSLAPVQSFQTQQAMGGQIQQLKREYGDDGYAGLAPKAAEYLRAWGRDNPAFVQQPGAIVTAFKHAASDAYQESRRSASAHTLDGSGPGQAPRTVDPAALILEGIDQAGGVGGGDGYF